MTGSHLIMPLVLGITIVGGAGAQQRPPILGVAHIALKTNDLAAARAFYGKYLGYEEAFSLSLPGGGIEMTFFKVNDRQYIEVLPGLKDETEDRLSHIAFETTNAEQMRAYLASRGVPATLRTLPDGNASVVIRDPDGHTVEFVQYMPESLEIRNAGRFSGGLADFRAHRARWLYGLGPGRGRPPVQGHSGLPRGLARRLHGRWAAQLGRHARPRGPRSSGVHARGAQPVARTLGVMNHLCLIVPSVDASYKTLLARGMKIADPPKIGRDGKWQLNLYDPNFTRTELMEPKPVQKPCCSPFLE